MTTSFQPTDPQLRRRPRAGPSFVAGAGQASLFVIILALFAVFMLWPIFQTVRVGLQGISVDGQSGRFTAAYLAAVFKDPQLRQGLFNSAAIAVGVTLISSLISIPLALLSHRYDFRGKGLVNGLLLVPLILPLCRRDRPAANPQPLRRVHRHRAASWPCRSKRTA